MVAERDLVVQERVPVSDPVSAQAEQKPAKQPIDWRQVINAVFTFILFVSFAALVGIGGWFAHSFFIHPTFAVARGEIEKFAGPGAGQFFTEMQAACPDDAKLPNACRLLFMNATQPQQKIASAKVMVPSVSTGD